MSDSIKSQLNRLRPLLKTNASKQRMMSVLAGQLICLVEGQDEPAARFDSVRRIVLAWANSRWKGSITQAAYDGEAFEVLPAHNIFIGACTIDSPRIWAARFHHPDAEVPARGWTIEVNVAELNGVVVFGYRTVVSSLEDCSVTVPRSTPTFVRSLHGKYVLRDGLYPLHGRPIEASSSDDIKSLCKQLLNPDRTLPVVVLSPLPRRLGHHGTYIISPDAIASRLMYRAHVVTLGVEGVDALIDEAGRSWSVYGGAVRAYWPGLRIDSASEEEHHPFFVPDDILDWHAVGTTPSGKDSFLQWIEEVCWNAQRSPRLRSRFAGYSEARTRANEMNLARLAASGDHKLRAQALEEQLKIMQQENQTLLELLNTAERERDDAIRAMDDLDGRLQASTTKADALEAQLNLRDVIKQTAPAAPAIPDSLQKIEEWCDRNLKGRVHVLSRALKETRRSEFEDVPLLYKSLLLLANEYRDMKLGGAQDRRPQFNAKCTELGAKFGRSAGETTWERFAEDYKVPWGRKGEKRVLDNHLTAGGGRDERHFLRIYFFFDDESKQVIVGWMPSHLPNSIT